MCVERIRIMAMRIAIIATIFCGGLCAQAFPDGFYYKFDGAGGSTPNFAVPGLGTNPAIITGQTQGGTGQFGGALQGIGGSGTTAFVNTGWATALGTGDWTVSFWLDLSAIATSAPFMYVYGDSITSSYRVFTNGAAGVGNITMRGNGMANIDIPGGASASAPSVVAWVYDSSVPEIRGYRNGVRLVTVPQAPLSISGTTNLKVGSYGTSTSLLPLGLMDEFRLYRRALSDAEILATWNVELGSGCAITSPVTGAMLGGTVVIDHDVFHAAMASVDATYEYSTNSGVTWLMATATGASVNPTLGIPTPSTALMFQWDTQGDMIALTPPSVTTDFRITIVDPMMQSSTCSVVGLVIDNVPPPPSCTLAQTTPGTASGVVNFDFVPDSSTASTVDATFEYSLDGGATFLLATPGGASTNPLIGAPILSPTIFEWNSRADSIGVGTPAPAVILRATTSDGTPVSGICATAPFDVDNTALCQGICGDCNLNAQGPDIIDALTAAQIAAGLILAPIGQVGCCDVNSSGAVEILDALRIAQNAAGLVAVLACL